ncbi:MAG: 50S ribosomal protein L29 [Alphaproteobacteria bacterium]|nr:50S ribosomal protein L29 [Alphaproteobacteria bacterium]
MVEKKTKVVKETKTAKKVDNSALTSDALSSKLTDLKKEAMNMRFQHAAGQLPKTHVIRKNRREIARVKTAIGAAKK